MKTEILTINESSVLAKSGDLIARAFLVALFFLAGTSKISGYDATAGWMEAMGVPGALLPLVIFAEIGGAIALLIGYQVRLASLALALFTLASAVIFHNNLGDQTQFLMFFKNVSIAGGFLLLTLNGANGFSLDAKLNK